MGTKIGFNLMCFKFCWAEESLDQLCRHSAKLKF